MQISLGVEYNNKGEQGEQIRERGEGRREREREREREKERERERFQNSSDRNSEYHRRTT